jgi:hypothetical protein
MKSRREVLFTSAGEDLTLDEVNKRLVHSGMQTVPEREYIMWQQTIVPMLRANMLYYNEFVITSQLSFSDLIHLINDRRVRQTIS